MRRRFAFLFLLAISAGGLLPAIPVGAVSRPAPTPQSRLPVPFAAEQTLQIDLDRDGDLDAVVVGGDSVVPVPETLEADDPDGNRVLLVTVRDRDGYRRVGLGRGALMCRRCGGAFWGVVPATIDVSASKNVIVVKQTAGSRELTDWTHRYRLEKGRVRLIGLDWSVVDRLTGSSVTVSTNYLTGLTITAVEGTPDPSLKSQKPGRKQGKPSVMYLESVEL